VAPEAIGEVELVQLIACGIGDGRRAVEILIGMLAHHLLQDRGNRIGAQRRCPLVCHALLCCSDALGHVTQLRQSALQAT